MKLRSIVTAAVAVAGAENPRLSPPTLLLDVLPASPQQRQQMLPLPPLPFVDHGRSPTPPTPRAQANACSGPSIERSTGLPTSALL